MGDQIMTRIYVASSWRNDYQPTVVLMLKNAGHEVYDFRHPFHGDAGFSWCDIAKEWKGWTAREYRNALLQSPIVAQGFMSDLRAMQWTEVCLLVLPCGRSAHLEAGWFCGQGKRCIILTQDGEEPELMALLATDICISMDEVINLLRTK